MSKWRKEIEAAINRSSAVTGSNTPDFILAEYLVDCLMAFDKAVNRRNEWVGKIGDEIDRLEASKTRHP